MSESPIRAEREVLRWWNRDATWHAIHSYGCDACEAR